MISLYNKKWFKFLVWSMASFFFFLNSCILICTLGPYPNETQVHLWMSGMMKAMETSMMAFSMQLEEGSELSYIVLESSQFILPMLIGGLMVGLILRFQKNYVKKEK